MIFILRWCLAFLADADAFPDVPVLRPNEANVANAWPIESSASWSPLLFQWYSNLPSERCLFISSFSAQIYIAHSVWSLPSYNDNDPTFPTSCRNDFYASSW